MGAPRRQHSRPPSRPSSARPRFGAADSSPSTSKQLSAALSALLQPLRLAGNLEFREADEPRAVHCCRRGDGDYRQEVCFLRIEEASKPPPQQPTRVRIGGGYHVSELRRTVATASAANACEQRGSPQRRAVGEAGSLQEASHSPNREDRFAHGGLPQGATAETYRFGAYTMGEDRCTQGDRRQNPSVWASYDNTATGDAAFRVLSSERRRLSRSASAGPGGARPSPRPAPPPGDAAAAAGAPAAASGPAAGAWAEREGGAVDASSLERGPAADALGALLGALGLQQRPGSIQGPKIHRSECTVGGKWSVELCYVCADRVAERIEEREVERPRPEDDACAQTEPWCWECCRFGHLASSCPSRPCKADSAAQTELWCSHCNSAGHVAANCGNCVCCVCGERGHMAKECPQQHLPPPPETRECSMQTELWCTYCSEPGHCASDCPLRSGPTADTGHGDGAPPAAELTFGGGQEADPRFTADPRPSRHVLETTRCADVRLATEARAARRSRSTRESTTARYRVGGGFEIAAPDVPGLSQGGLDADAARRALSSARAAGHLDAGSLPIDAAPGRSSGARRPGSAPPAGRAVKVVSRGQGFESYAELEQERCCRAGGGQAPEGPQGYLVGTFVPGFHDRHRFGSDRGARTAFKVYRSRITRDAACPRPEPSSATTSMRLGMPPGRPPPVEPAAAACEEAGDSLGAEYAGLEAVQISASKYSGGNTPSTTAAEMSIITGRSSERTDPSLLDVHPHSLPIPARPASWSSPAQAQEAADMAGEYFSPGTLRPEPERERPLPQGRRLVSPGMG